MNTGPQEPWNDSKRLAQGILHDRNSRRKWMAGMLFVPLGMIAVGLWVLDGWIHESPLRMLIWWGACAFLTCIVMLFAVYDALAVVREERDKFK
ncbi:MAG: hypothetical protein EOP85_10395 [Verrucomicrobiaceae bacterium]|nr:MAG: hypothetical protein EOP85_10395 [Verrucomicrobiaceae bacterium]